jgi:hypothetical protein
VPCPNCRASAPRQQIAPGYFRCTNELHEVHVDTDGVTPRPVYYICGATYHDASERPGLASGPACRCGTFAVAQCTSCGEPLCGNHRRALRGRWVCASCLQRHEQDEFHMRIALQEQEGRRYQGLPAWSRQELLDYMTGRRTDLKDGRDRKAGDWTHRDVASLLTEALGIERNARLRGTQPAGRVRVLTPDGFVVTLVDISIAAYEDRWVPGLVEVRTTDARPDDPVNSAADLGLDIHRLPEIYRGARGELCSQGDMILFEETRAKDAQSGWNPFLIALLLLVLDIGLGIYLIAS